ncbi:laccase-21-like isoform X2 [Drosophila teissieri]|uniref:laccase-21-like isoform X2 n=1 Tax=Drosophila teissieri TaxID=7243 RepID=UPI001CBA296E|nr:laccase-21-like isoform X2 [Drosophila teissieri]
MILNPLDAICDRKRPDAVCVSNLKNAKRVDKGVLVERPDVKIFLPFRFFVYEPKALFIPNTYNRFLVASDADHLISLIDEVSYISPPSPMLSQYNDIPQEYYCNGDNRPVDCGENCQCTHKIDIPLNAIVEVVLVDEVQQINISHPFHLHGTSFYVLGLGRSPDKQIKRMNLKHALELDKRGLLERQYLKPSLKDTVAVPNNGYAILRFRADNPGFWLFHCHFQYHIVIGMNLVFQIVVPM